MPIIKLVFAASISFLAGCQAVLPLPVSAPDMAVSHTKIDAALQGITVTTNQNLLSRLLIDPQDWQTALQASVNRMAIFQPSAPTQVTIAVEIIGFETPPDFEAVASNAIARYKILNHATGDVLFNESIISTGVAPNTASLTPYEQHRAARLQAVQHNIDDFLKSLETATIRLPGAATGKALH